MTEVHKSCGACSVCCKDLTFEMDGAVKPAGVLCPHACPPTGCSIHLTRPSVCRTYFCGWRHLTLGEEWRPDKSEILISFREGPAPGGLKDGVEFHLVGALDRIFWVPLVEYIATLIADQVPVYLSLPGEAGYQSPWVYLNDIAELQEGLARRDFAATASALSQAVQVCVEYPKTKMPDNNRGE
jgi:hypothetical protein